MKEETVDKLFCYFLIFIYIYFYAIAIRMTELLIDQFSFISERTTSHKDYAIY